MPKPVKIKKPKSFMFTTKHHSFAGWMGCISGIISIGVFLSAVYLAFINKGRSSVSIGGAAFFAMILDFLGVISGITALSERDIHRWVPITAIAGNSVMLFVWVMIMIH